MIITETKDIDKIKRVLCDSDIYERITDDGCLPVEEFEPVTPCESVYYLTDENDIGIVFLHWKNGVTLEGHIQVLKEHRGDAIEFGRLALKWIWANTEAIKITAVIPSKYPSVAKFIVKSGFKAEGISENSYMKNGVLFNQLYFGISR
jgi:hypothetical protein